MENKLKNHHLVITFQQNVLFIRDVNALPFINFQMGNACSGNQGKGKGNNKTGIKVLDEFCKCGGPRPHSGKRKGSGKRRGSGHSGKGSPKGRRRRGSKDS